MTSAALQSQIIRSWKDVTRGRQNARIARLAYTQDGECHAAAAKARAYALELKVALEQEYRRRTGLEPGRIIVPSLRAFAAVLGLFRTCVTLKKEPMHRLQLSRADIAQHAKLSPATTAAVLRWLDSRHAEHRGVQLDRRPLGWIHRAYRYGEALLVTPAGRTRKCAVNRTNATWLTPEGAIALKTIAKQARELAGPARAANDNKPKPASPPKRRIDVVSHVSHALHRVQERSADDDPDFHARRAAQKRGDVDYNAWALRILSRDDSSGDDNRR